MRRTALVLVLLSFLATGCASDRKLIEHRTGWKESSRTLPVDAKCTLAANNGTSFRSPIQVSRDTEVGFRRDPDGRLVAFAGREVFPVEEDQSEWRFRRIPATAWDRFADRTQERIDQVATSMKMFAIWPFIIISGSITGIWP